MASEENQEALDDVKNVKEMLLHTDKEYKIFISEWDIETLQQAINDLKLYKKAFKHYVDHIRLDSYCNKNYCDISKTHKCNSKKHNCLNCIEKMLLNEARKELENGK